MPAAPTSDVQATTSNVRTEDEEGEGEVGVGEGAVTKEELGILVEVEEERHGSAGASGLGLVEERVYDSEEDAIGEELNSEEMEDGSVILVGRVVRRSESGSVSGIGDKGKGIAFGEIGGGGGTEVVGVGNGGTVVEESALVGMAVDP